MTLHIFQSTQTPEMYGFTVDPSGANLPADEGPWVDAGTAMPLGTTMASPSPEIAKAIEANGFALVKGHSVSTVTDHVAEAAQAGNRARTDWFLFNTIFVAPR